MSQNSGTPTDTQSVTKKKKKKGIIDLDPHLRKEYRLRFETFYDYRYIPRRETRVNINLHLRPFIETLGFSTYHTGIRYLQVTDDQFRTLDNLCSFVVYCKQFEGAVFSNIEKKAIASLATAATLFTLGDDQTRRYLRVEQEAIHQFKVDIERIRVHAKHVYSLIMSRLDQYLTCSPISPIRWSLLEAPSTKETPKLRIFTMLDDIELELERIGRKTPKLPEGRKVSTSHGRARIRV